MRFLSTPPLSPCRPGLIWPVLTLLAIALLSYGELAIRLWPTEGIAYGPLLAVIGIGLLFHHGRAVHWVPAAGFPYSGAVFLLLGSLGYVLGRSQSLELIELAALIPLAAGSLAVLGGNRALYQLRFPLLFLLFSLPYPGWVVDSLTQPLKLLISQWSESVLYAAGYPIARNGVLISLGQYRLLVADACSGLHSLIFLSALGLLYVHFTGPRASWHRWVLIATLVPIAILANFLRVLILLLVTYHFGNAVGQSYWHDLAGLVLFRHCVFSPLRA
jgi:exosortase